MTEWFGVFWRGDTVSEWFDVAMSSKGFTPLCLGLSAGCSSNFFASFHRTHGPRKHMNSGHNTLINTSTIADGLLTQARCRDSTFALLCTRPRAATGVRKR